VSFYSNLAPTSRAAIHSARDVREVPNYLLEVDNSVVIPVGKKIRLLLTSADVIHAWWVPQFGMKKDAIPGFINEMWIRVEKPGTYRGQCAELCGNDHGFMPIVVEVKSQADYDAWVAGQKK
jgi:cytochrome c oxidase subunit 2